MVKVKLGKENENEDEGSVMHGGDVVWGGKLGDYKMVLCNLVDYRKVTRKLVDYKMVHVYNFGGSLGDMRERNWRENIFIYLLWRK